MTQSLDKLYDRALTATKMAGAKKPITLVFLPYVTPDFPEQSGSVQELYSSVSGARKRFSDLRDQDLIERALISEKFSGGQRSILEWDDFEGGTGRQYAHGMNIKRIRRRRIA